MPTLPFPPGLAGRAAPVPHLSQQPSPQATDHGQAHVAASPRDRRKAAQAAGSLWGVNTGVTKGNRLPRGRTQHRQQDHGPQGEGYVSVPAGGMAHFVLIQAYNVPGSWKAALHAPAHACHLHQSFPRVAGVGIHQIGAEPCARSADPGAAPRGSATLLWGGRVGRMHLLTLLGLSCAPAYACASRPYFVQSRAGGSMPRYA